MNAITKAQNAYRNDAQLIRTDRDTEYNVFAQITNRLKTASSRGSEGFHDLVSALHDNRRLWTILATDVADNSNTLPKELRARIVYLSEFTRQHSSKVLAKKESADALVQINHCDNARFAQREGKTMTGLVLKLSPKERVLINGAVIENGDRRSRLFDHDAKREYSALAGCHSSGRSHDASAAGLLCGSAYPFR